ncbi:MULTISPECIES: ABC transporter ATP-binding protein [Eubacterium]|uniref:Putative ABC transport system ATP-binding protein n=1 Tax=Eubacterium barkeri TaxID=1528 RepID=A0A1H3AEH2_EUBBA|nr:ABC transporter ATP-binding protein [Eubacterium barkeri]SDX28112.1 putative ABC transport system ATP-binding protein [Eubacterium barkeri]
MSVLEIRQLEKTYPGSVPVQALKGIDLTVEKGEFIAIMGPSGSGKSTFLNVISTIDQPTGGQVRIGGKDPHGMDDAQLAQFRRSTLGFIFQDFNLLPTLTVEENILLPLTLEGVKVPLMKKRAATIEKMLGIAHLADKRTYEISGGQAQRVAVARAVIQNPALLLADEPTGNLDSKAAKDVMGIFTMLNTRMKSTILMVTHDATVASYCQRVYIIKDGLLYQKINSDGVRAHFYEHILHAMTQLGGTPHDAV